MAMAAKTSSMTLGADMRLCSPDGAGGRPYQGGPRDSALVAFAAGVAVDIGHDLALRRGKTHPSGTMAGLAGSNPRKGAVTLIVAAMFSSPVVVAIETTHRTSAHNNIVDRGKSDADIDCPA